MPGSFATTVRAARWANEEGLRVQVNTVVRAETVSDLPAIMDRLSSIGIAQWALFFLVQVGRGKVLQGITPAESEEVMEWVYEVGQDAPFPIRTTEAPHYRRVALQRERAVRQDGGRPTDIGHVRRGFGVRDGNGVMFVSHMGEVFPSGFLPLATGNVLRESPVDLYRRAPLFRALRDPERLKGKCGRCEYRQVCGGSRARAYTASGDPLGSDPLCPYQPSHREPAMASR